MGALSDIACALINFLSCIKYSKFGLEFLNTVNVLTLLDIFCGFCKNFTYHTVDNQIKDSLKQNFFLGDIVCYLNVLFCDCSFYYK